MAEKVINSLRDFPSVEDLLQEKTLAKDYARVPRPIAANIVKETIAELKDEFKKQEKITHASLKQRIRNEINLLARQAIGRVINATGIIVHTNLGRAPLSEALFEAIKATVTGYGNIEFSVKDGVRGKRGEIAEKYLATLTGSESATIVNNCAAALFVTLNTLANRKNVLISRGELVQIGGGFRIPDILKKAGAKLNEVGTSNITTVDDYRDATDKSSALLLKVHKSNYAQSGFTEEVSLKQLVALGRELQMPVVNDLGSGVLVPTKPIIGYAEPTVQQSVRDGADLTCFSGDKMLGGPQAGIIVGNAELIKKIKKNPIFRTIRVDKIVLSALECMCKIYLDGTHEKEIRLWEYLSVPESELYKRGKTILRELGNPGGVAVEATSGYVGGGALPESTVPSVAVSFGGNFKATQLIRKFRELDPPIIGRIENDRFFLDLRAIDPADLGYLLTSIKQILAEG